MRKPETTGFSDIDVFLWLLSTLLQEYRIIVEYIQLSGISEGSLEEDLNKLLWQEEDLASMKQEESAYWARDNRERDNWYWLRDRLHTDLALTQYRLGDDKLLKSC
jgi:hypothetical protein